MAIRLPPIKIDYLEALTDDTGVFQHAKYCIPKRSEGYTTDDNARALIVCTRYTKLKKEKRVERLAKIYLAFLNHMQKPEGSFHNYLAYERTFLDVDGSEDSMGRAMWSCGCTLNSTLPVYMKRAAKEMFDKALPWVFKSTSLRFYSFTILGLAQYNRAYPDNDIRVSIGKLADSLVQRYLDTAKDDWRWFETYLTYDNARLPQALFEAYDVVGKPNYLMVAEETMDFLLQTQMLEGVFLPIGNDGWYKRGENRAFYDQQPLEAAAMTDAAVDAFYATKNEVYIKVAASGFEWFLGKNSNKVMVYDPQTGGCYDGLNVVNVNMNQGGESSISYLLARLKLEELKQMIQTKKEESILVESLVK
ncbi:MAG: glycosyltransferase [Candidatus Bathyarchaeota archaeon]|nr:glycosyltransferase [Candidatus Bathyarchaeota archaeon]